MSKKTIVVRFYFVVAALLEKLSDVGFEVWSMLPLVFRNTA
jgi:hypothetical protein